MPCRDWPPENVPVPRPSARGRWDPPGRRRLPETARCSVEDQRGFSTAAPVPDLGEYKTNELRPLFFFLFFLRRITDVPDTAGNKENGACTAACWSYSPRS